MESVLNRGKRTLFFSVSIGENVSRTSGLHTCKYTEGGGEGEREECQAYLEVILENMEGSKVQSSTQ